MLTKIEVQSTEPMNNTCDVYRPNGKLITPQNKTIALRNYNQPNCLPYINRNTMVRCSSQNESQSTEEQSKGVDRYMSSSDDITGFQVGTDMATNELPPDAPTLDTATLDEPTLKEQYKKANKELIKIMVRTKGIVQIYIVHLGSQSQNKAVNHCVNDAIQRLTQKTIINGFNVSIEQIPYQNPGHPIFHAIIPRHYSKGSLHGSCLRT